MIFNEFKNALNHQNILEIKIKLNLKGEYADYDA
jgi:hypothetical protein